ncbi:COR domain-containing protein [Chryseobacterium sp. Tr-659]|uniref:leucine-rich repeat domain-containing protein n=1 Tax=Chryseobacterium sp. Tr-659 TaxID=2608340 RepID=UPI00141DA4FE|nr:COR domain-containing protein [Chryseobacterium sp. Tr-659]
MMYSSVYDSIFNVKADLIVIPISTEGTISRSFEKGLENLNISPDIWEYKNYKFGEIKIHFEKELNLYIVFACSVDEYKNSYYGIQLIGKRLSKMVHELKKIKKIVTPILGTGAGNLAPYFSYHIMRNAFYENQEVNHVELIFCTINENILNLIKDDRLNITTSSGQLVIEAELNNILISESVEKIQYAKNFYFELALEKYKEFVIHTPPSNHFYDTLSEKFKESKLAFKDFIASRSLTEEQLKFTTLCGELIAYLDYNAYHKNIWNQYPDKRVLAKSGVRQNDWFLNLLKYKVQNNPNAVSSSSIKNALKYLQYPEYRLTMLSEDHRKKVFQNIFPGSSYNENSFWEIITKFFERLGIKSQHPKNFGAICSRILYLPFIRPVWDQNIRKETVLELEESTDLTQAILLIDKCLKTKSELLDLGNCGLTDLMAIPELFDCTHLECLILSNEYAIYEKGKWKRVESSNIGKKNNIKVLPNLINNLSKLRILVCGGDWNKSKDQNWNRWGINALSSITKLTQLKHLNLSNNLITNLKGLNNLKNLQIVYLNNNEISKTESLNNLISLRELYLSNNKIKTVDFISELKNIETLDLHHNEIKDLGPARKVIEKIGIRNDKWIVKTLNITKNPLEQPPIEIVSLGKEAVLGFFDDIAKRGKYINKDIKVILVGNSEVGKSTMVKYLDQEAGLDDKHPSTLWLEEKIVKSKYTVPTIGEECLLHIFDFGGHDYYHDTHHLFYSTNTIYLLLWDQNTNQLNLRKSLQLTKENTEIEIETQDYPIKYWLDSVKFHIKDIEADNFEFEIKREITYDSQLLLIQNKVDDASLIVFQDNKTIKENYPFTYDIINLSLKPKRNLDHFDHLFSEMLSKMKVIGAVLPKFYEPIKSKIAEYNGPEILNFSEFLDYCNSILEDPIDKDQCRRLIKYLNQIGVLLYIYKKDDTEERIYIDKKWVIDNMHKVLSKLVEKNGEFDRDYVLKIMDSDNNKTDNLLSIMQEFKMIFKHPYSNTYIAPLYLPKLPDGKIKLFLNENQIPYRRFEYNGFIHKTIILSIFQKLGTSFSLDKSRDIFYYWKDGLIIKNPATQEIIMVRFYLGNEEGNAHIDLFDLTQKKTSKFVEEVLTYIREVNQGYELEEMITLNGEDYISKQVLNKNASIGKHIFTEKKISDFKKGKENEKYFNIKNYMNFIDNPVKKKKVVISYSKKDVAQVHNLIRYLNPLIAEELIEQPWYCTLLNPAEEWNTVIKAKFEEADIIFYMISDFFYSTPYIVDHEITTGIDRYKKGDPVKIIPVILEFYDWGRNGDYNLQQFSALPYQAKPISDFHNPKMAWSTITASVRMMIIKDLDPGKSIMINRHLEEIYERQVSGKLDKNSI